MEGNSQQRAGPGEEARVNFSEGREQEQLDPRDEP